METYTDIHKIYIRIEYVYIGINVHVAAKRSLYGTEFGYALHNLRERNIKYVVCVRFFATPRSNTVTASCSSFLFLFCMCVCFYVALPALADSHADSIEK